MPKSCRILFLEDVSRLSDFADRFGGSSSEYETIPPGTKVPLKLKVSAEKMDTLHDERVALGTFLYDEPIVITRRDGTQIVDVQTLPVRFGLIEGRSVHLVIFAGQTLALYVRARMGPLFTQHLTRATGVTITADAINRFLREHPNTQRICNWVGISLPRISKARISGQDIDQTSDYRRYEQYGSKNSVMVTLHTVGWTISINAEGCLTIWHDVDELEAIRFVRDEVLPLCQ